MAADNKFLLLNKSKDTLEEMVKFIQSIRNSDENDDSEYRLVTYEMEIKPYGKYWGLESMFRRSILDDLWYWIKEKNRQDLLKDLIPIIHYEHKDEVELADPNGGASDDLFDAFSGEMYEAGIVFDGVLPMTEIVKYFCYIKRQEG